MLFLCVAQKVSAQKTDPSASSVFYSNTTLKELEQLQQAALQSDYAYRKVDYLCTNIGPRLTGSLQAEQAIEYVADEMRKLGLNVRLQKIKVPHWVRGEERAELVEWSGMRRSTTQKIVVTALGGSVSTGANGLTAEVVVVRNFEELNKLGREKVGGKIVLFNNIFDRELAEGGFGLQAYKQAVAYRALAATEAAKFGAVAAIVRSAGGSQNRLVHTGSMFYAGGVEKIPAAATSFEDAETIDRLAKMGKVRLKLTLTPQTLPDTTTYNVIADLKGSEKPDEIVIVSGHLDSWDLGCGAIDDGAGIAVSMQVPYLLKNLKLRPKRTIRFVAWMSEENGATGGNQYAKEESAAKQFAAIESDTGADHPYGFNFVGNPDALPFLAPLSDILRDQGAGEIQIQTESGTDIAPLTRQGVPSFEPWFDMRNYFKYHHTAADTLDKINPEYLAENGSVVAVLAYGLANLEQPLPR